MFGGAAIGFYQGDTLKIVDDLQATKHTEHMTKDATYIQMYQKYHVDVPRFCRISILFSSHVEPSGAIAGPATNDFSFGASTFDSGP